MPTQRLGQTNNGCMRGAALVHAILILGSGAAAAFAQAPSVFKEETKSCDQECTKFGNCNGETGTCDCPFGLTGPSCQDRLFPACHSSKEPGTVPHYGTWYPKNCLCVKQLREHPLSCPTYTHNTDRCLYDILHTPKLLCYRYKGRPDPDQLSDSPAVDDPDVEWLSVMAFPRWTETQLGKKRVPKEIKTPDDGTYRPLSECPERCHNRGWCQAGGYDNLAKVPMDPNQPWCNCHGYYQGRSCEVAELHHCYRNCSGVGTCESGWCHCQAGYWGHGCTRRKAYSSSVGWRPNHAEIKIYVYDLPNNIVHRKEVQDQWALIDIMYNAELEFTDQLLGDWAVRTENPWEAALFYVPIFTYWYTGNVGDPYHIFDHVTHHLQSIAPFFNLTRGRNHIMWATCDRGACALQTAPPVIQHPIKLVHFGQSPQRPYAHRLKGENEHTAAGVLGHSLLGALPQPGRRFPGFDEFNAGDIMNEFQICIRPEKDVVAPNHLHSGWLQPSTLSKVWNTTILPDGTRVVTRRADATRPLTLLFSGYIRPDMTYSQGVRQTIKKMFGSGGKYDPAGPNARPDIQVLGPIGDAAIIGMQNTKFCLCPMGSGWGIRLSEAMVSGCVPVIIQDHVYQAHWDVLPFEDFSIRLGRNEVAHMVDILDDVTPQQLDRLQAGVEKYHRAFMWDSLQGGLAYNSTITALKRRAISLWSANYRRASRRRRRLLQEDEQ